MTEVATNAAVDLPFTEFYDPSSSASSTNTGTPVVILHGLLGSKRNFATLAKSLGNRLDLKRRILAVDLRNHGEHGKANWQDDMSYTSMAEDVATFLQQQKLDKVIVVGHSMGGKVAQTLALQQPQLVEGLVVLDMAPVTYSPEEPHWQAVTSIIQTLQSITTSTDDGEPLTKQTVDRKLQSTIPDPALRGFCLTNWDNRNNEWAIPVDKIARQLDVLAGFDISTLATTQVNGDAPKEQEPLQYHGDTFFIHGGQSKFVRSAHMSAIAGYFPNHMLTTIRGAGHWVHAEAPDATIALLKRYLDR
ncbi:Protein ABHD11 [Seminavis robusta]|uniref:Protein ABHD11 n=1 Tax=Seminavis robusta TaxID=568900 RepID=A0A9N8EXC6_9STRA|nr:Protein ABHD11 [Seminavis robusta]|eukprot:Sro1973_g308660.1 Protein ABHD11 (304) ;mRNA; r:5979-6994